MIVVLLVVLAAISVTAWLMTYQTFRDNRALQVRHGMLSGGLLAAAAVHVLGVLYASVRNPENLIRSLFSGRKRM